MPHRPLIALLLSFCLVFQVAFANQAVMVSSGDDTEHALLHWLDRSHHHHDDGGYHEAASADAAMHVQLDGLTHVTAIFSIPPGCSVRTPWSLTLRTTAEQPTPPPFLEGPERPPRLIA